jgi:maleylpyruvate isomerase
MGNDAKTVRGAVLAGHARLIALLDGLTDADMRAPSALPDWSRGHVLTHLEHSATAYARQVEYALDGKMIEVYDGRQRPSVAPGAARSAAEIRAAIAETTAELDRAWDRVGPDDWDRPVRYRDGWLRGLLFGRWREVEIHLTDLDLGYRSSDWSTEFCLHAVNFLGARAAKGIQLTVSAGGYQCMWGTGESVEVSGELTDVTAWLAGRDAAGALTTSTGKLPELGPWP